MKRRYHLSIIGIAAIGLAAGIQAREWKGDTGIRYPTLAACQDKSKACKPVDRLIQVGSASEIFALEARARTGLLRAGGAVAEPATYFSLATPASRKAAMRLSVRKEGAKEVTTTKSCHNTNGNFYHKPPCKKGDVEVDVHELRIAAGAGGVYDFDRSGVNSTIGTFNSVGTGTAIGRPVDSNSRAAEANNSGTAINGLRIESTSPAVDPPK